MKLGLGVVPLLLMSLAACAEGLLTASPGEEAEEAGTVIPDAARSSDAPKPKADASVPEASFADAPVTPVDTGTPPVETGPPPPTDCPAANGQYTIMYGLLLQGDGGSMKPCPCGSGECCYTPPLPIGPAACLPVIN